MITFACENCGKKLRVADEAAGKKARCPDCAHRSLIPPTVGPTDTRGDAPRTAGGRVSKASPSEQPTLGVGAAPGAAGKVTVPGYEVLEELGRGGMGVVYKARQQRPRRLVALKMVLAGEHASSDALARFRHEAEAVAKLQHPNIVTVHEVGEHDGRPFFSLEYVEGGSLAGLLADEGMSSRQSARLVHDVARGVHFAHKRGIVHRDLKPANVLLAASEDEDEKGGARWLPKVADFGLAKQMDQMASAAPAGPRTASGAVMGTPAYMAPEQAAGKKKITPAADVYSLGAILYHCLAGRPPFEAASMLDTLMLVATEEPAPVRQFNAKVPRDLETICHKCLQKDPAGRYASAAALADDLRRFLDGEPIKARPPGAFGRLGRWLGKRKEVVYIAAGSLLAVAVVAGSFWLLTPEKKDDPIPHTSGRGQQRPEEPDDTGPITRVRESAARMTSSNNLKQLVLGMHSLHDQYNGFPPAAICDNSGKALLSWRVAVLPFVELGDVYKKFRLNEAWDSADNKKLLDEMPKLFEAPGADAPKNNTFYQVFTGPDTPFDTNRMALGGAFGRQGPRLPGFTDGTSNTLLIVEAGKAVPWTKPEDVAYDPKRPLPALGGPFRGNYLAAMADGQVIPVSRTVSVATLRAAITPAGGEVLGGDWPGGTEKPAKENRVAAQ